MAYDYLEYIKEEKIEDVRNVVKIFTRDEIKKYEDVVLRDVFKDYDYLIEIKDYHKIIESSVLKYELEKIERLKIRFEELNNEMLKEKGFAEIDELEETSDREIINRRMVVDLRRRNLNFTNQDAIYFKNKEDESYNDIKGYYLDIALSWQYNRDFELIARKLKNSVASKRQAFTYFKAIYSVSDGKQKYGIVIPELNFNNERFTKDLYKLFIPYTSLTLCELIQVTIKESNGWKKSAYPLVRNSDNRVVQIQWR